MVSGKRDREIHLSLQLQYVPCAVPSLPPQQITSQFPGSGVSNNVPEQRDSLRGVPIRESTLSQCLALPILFVSSIALVYGIGNFVLL